MKEWVKWLALGILSIVFGIFVLGNTVAASVAVTTVTGILFLITGAFQIYGAISGEDGTGSKIISIALGALMVLLGLSFTFNPLEGMISLALLVLILLAASGIMRIVLAWRMKQTRFFWPMLISGALSVLLAAYIVVNFSAVAPQLLGILLGLELLFNGAGLVVLAFFLRAVKGAVRKA